MKALSSYLNEAVVWLDPKFVKTLEKNGIEVSVSTGDAYLINKNGWDMYIMPGKSRKSFCFLDEPEEFNAISAENPETGDFFDLDLSALKHDGSDIEFSKENAQILADALNSVK